MKYGLIDIGSNTIRAVVYDNGVKTAEDVVYAELLGYVADGTLSGEGKVRLIGALLRLLEICEGCCVRAFATASLREVSDKAGLSAEIEKQCGVIIDFVSKEREAYYDRLALESIGKTDGAGFDLGGGSCQVFYGDFSGSYPVGSLRMARSFNDISKVYAYACSVFANIPKTEKLYGMGGTAKTVSAIMGNNILHRDDVEKLMTDKNAAEDFPERKETINAGAAVMLALMDSVGADEIEVVGVGVREGYLREIITKNQA